MSERLSDRAISEAMGALRPETALERAIIGVCEEALARGRELREVQERLDWWKQHTDALERNWKTLNDGLCEDRDGWKTRAERAEEKVKRYEAEPYSKLLGENSVLRHQLKRLTKCEMRDDTCCGSGSVLPDTLYCRHCHNAAELEGMG